MGDGWEVWIIGRGINSQLRPSALGQAPQYLLAEIASLSDFVKNNLSLYFSEEVEQTRSREAWLEIDQALLKFESTFISG